MRAWPLVLFVMALVVYTSLAAATRDAYVKLTGKQIRIRIIGNTLTDDVHWSEYYRPDGVLIAVDMGRARNGRWRIDGDELCTSKENLRAGDCYEVWVTKDDRIKFRYDGADVFDGILLKKGKAW